MNNDDLPTVGEWYQHLPRWRKVLFNALSVVVGDIRAIEWSGYHRSRRSKFAQRNEAKHRQQ